MKKGPLQAPCSAGSAASKWLTAERSSWTKWANSHQTPRSHYERFLAYPAISLSGGRSHWFYGRLQITIRGSDDANVDLDGLGAHNSELRRCVFSRRIMASQRNIATSISV